MNPSKWALETAREMFRQHGLALMDVEDVALALDAARRKALEEARQIAFEVADERQPDVKRTEDKWVCACGRIMDRIRALANEEPSHEDVG